MIDGLDTWLRQGQHFLTNLLKPFFFVHDPSKRIFWGYLVGSLVIAALALVIRDRKQGVKELYQKLLSPRIWLHPSSFLDMKLMLVKSLTKTLFFFSWIISSYELAIAVVRFIHHHWGPSNNTSLSNTEITFLYTAVLFVSSDFSRYFLHRLCHRLPLLWQFHQVHHSAEVMTPLTLYRSHPVEHLLFIVRGALVTGLITGFFFYLFGTRAIQYQVLGVNVLGLLFNMLGANLRHSHVWFSYGKHIEHILLSPAQHQLHHSVDQHHYDRNYGSCLSIWDWLGGSLKLARERHDLRFGLSPQESNHDSRNLISALIGPFKACWKMASARLLNRVCGEGQFSKRRRLVPWASPNMPDRQ